jgi:predicted DCC family thiol-disulfide oxidoreductase YuxK
MENHHPIVLFDGICNYCNSWVNFAIRHDRKSVLRFTPLQSETGMQLRQQYGLGDEIDSVVLIDKGKVYKYADAALGVAKYLDWPAKMLYGLMIFPRFIRQPFYKWIGKNRYKWFGKKETCMIPTADIKSRFL